VSPRASAASAKALPKPRDTPVMNHFFIKTSSNFSSLAGNTTGVGARD
jgi:hypothetical protein